MGVSLQGQCVAQIIAQVKCSKNISVRLVVHCTGIPSYLHEYL